MFSVFPKVLFSLPITMIIFYSLAPGNIVVNIVFFVFNFMSFSRIHSITQVSFYDSP